MLRPSPRGRLHSWPECANSAGSRAKPSRSSIAGRRAAPSAIASASSVEWKDDDFDVLADGAVVGRIFQAVGRSRRLCAFSTAFPGALARLLMASSNNSLAGSNKPGRRGSAKYSRMAREPLAAPKPNTKGFQCSAHL